MTLSSDYGTDCLFYAMYYYLYFIG